MTPLATLQLRHEKRPYKQVGTNLYQSEREFLDFIVNDRSLWQLCQQAGLDNISCLWIPHLYQADVLRLLLEAPADFSDGRIALYVCAECGDIHCGAVSVRITQHNNLITWSDFAYQNNYDASMTHTLAAFSVIDGVSFEVEAYRKLLIPLLANAAE